MRGPRPSVGGVNDQLTGQSKPACAGKKFYRSISRLRGQKILSEYQPPARAKNFIGISSACAGKKFYQSINGLRGRQS